MAGGLGVPGGTTCIIASSLSPANFKISNISFTFFCTLNLQILIYYLINPLNFNNSDISLSWPCCLASISLSLSSQASGLMPTPLDKYAIALALVCSLDCSLSCSVGILGKSSDPVAGSTVFLLVTGVVPAGATVVGIAADAVAGAAGVGAVDAADLDVAAGAAEVADAAAGAAEVADAAGVDVAAGAAGVDVAAGEAGLGAAGEAGLGAAGAGGVDVAAGAAGLGAAGAGGVDVAAGLVDPITLSINSSALSLFAAYPAPNAPNPNNFPASRPL
jgi:hypothetical protein